MHIVQWKVPNAMLILGQSVEHGPQIILEYSDLLCWTTGEETCRFPHGQSASDDAENVHHFGNVHGHDDGSEVLNAVVDGAALLEEVQRQAVAPRKQRVKGRRPLQPVLLAQHWRR